MLTLTTITLIALAVRGAVIFLNNTGLFYWLSKSRFKIVSSWAMCDRFCIPFWLVLPATIWLSDNAFFGCVGALAIATINLVISHFE
jgi:hypothetical protein